MFAKFGFFLLLFTGLSQLLFSQNIDYQIYITTPGYTSVRSYSKADFEKVKHDFLGDERTGYDYRFPL